MGGEGNENGGQELEREGVEMGDPSQLGGNNEASEKQPFEWVRARGEQRRPCKAHNDGGVCHPRRQGLFDHL